jgi:hypothetical protein
MSQNTPRDALARGFQSFADEVSKMHEHFDRQRYAMEFLLYALGASQAYVSGDGGMPTLSIQSAAYEQPQPLQGLSEAERPSPQQDNMPRFLSQARPGGLEERIEGALGDRLPLDEPPPPIPEEASPGQQDFTWADRVERGFKA